MCAALLTLTDFWGNAGVDECLTQRDSICCGLINGRRSATGKLRVVYVWSKIIAGFALILLLFSGSGHANASKKVTKGTC
jgi:hypothetical protein